MSGNGGEKSSRPWRRRAAAEVAEMRSTVSNLESTLNDSEEQVRKAEKQRADLKKMLDELRVRYDKLSKDYKTAQAKLSASSVSSPSGRSSMESSRSGTPTNGAAAGAPDTVYLKTILLQFLEQKDNKLRAQLVPVLGKLLRFDR